MFKFNRTKFFEGITPIVGVLNGKVKTLTDSQRSGLEFLLGQIEKDSRWQTIPQVAYFLATVAHECAKPLTVFGLRQLVRTFQPIHEFGSTAYLNAHYDTRTDLGNTPAKDGDGAANAGKGYVQNTGGDNHRNAGVALKGFVITQTYAALADQEVRRVFQLACGSYDAVTVKNDTFIKYPALLMIPIVSYLDAVNGMFTGRYTGKKITDYINSKGTDYFHCRRVINRLDRADDIAKLAVLIEKVLKGSLETSTPSLVSGAATSFIQRADDKPTPAGVITSTPEPDSATTSEPLPASIETSAGTTVLIEKHKPSLRSRIRSGVMYAIAQILLMYGAVKAFLFDSIGLDHDTVASGVRSVLGISPQVFWFGLLGLVILALAVWYSTKSEERANERTIKELDIRADRDKDNVEVRQKK